MSESEEGYDQGTWEHIKPARRVSTGRKDGRAPRNFIDVEAFRRLLKRIEATTKSGGPAE